MLSITIPTRGNKREVPPGVSPGAWFDEMRELARHPDRDALLTEISWAHPVMEYLDPALLIRFQVQALVWRKHTGEFPEEVAWWWPVRLGRRLCQVPHTTSVVEANIDSSGVLHCGYCEARWSSNYDGTPHPERCKLCDRLWLVVSDEREERWPTK